MADGQFQEDLFYRLNVIPVQIPPLRERREDIPVLVEHFVQQARAAHRQAASNGVEDGVLAALQRYDWPGNVRELENTIERAVVLSTVARIGDPDISVVGAASARRRRPCRRCDCIRISSGRSAKPSAARSSSREGSRRTPPS